MKINVILSPANVDELYFSGKNTVVIDVLRASSTIVTALHNGAREVIPVGSVEFAMKASSSMFGGQTLIGGERNSRKIDGFNLGNSPLEYTAEAIAGKAIVLFTTNGSRAVVKAKFSQSLVIACFLNCEAVVRFLAAAGQNVEILCSGRTNLFSMEDTVCAGKIVSGLLMHFPDAELSDAARAAEKLAKVAGKNLKKMLAESDQGAIILEAGLQDDIPYCARLNVTDVVPVFSNGVLRASLVEQAGE